MANIARIVLEPDHRHSDTTSFDLKNARDRLILDTEQGLFTLQIVKLADGSQSIALTVYDGTLIVEPKATNRIQITASVF